MCLQIIYLEMWKEMKMTFTWWIMKMLVVSEHLLTKVSGKMTLVIAHITKSNGKMEDLTLSNCHLQF